MVVVVTLEVVVVAAMVVFVNVAGIRVNATAFSVICVLAQGVLK